ncbi:hypothetical protein N341_12157 [Tyto alba]|uniref:Uncharacterized protein n=1 Tax=Tyto alba TaxID=56313 RepID=A0A093H069_TYTAL|nr:hypothetical protein N341_12157 [Tyto alba]
MLITRQALICDALSHLSFAVVTRTTCYKIYQSPTIPQFICWQPSPGAWNVNKT